MPENKKNSITEKERQGAGPPKKGRFDSMIKVAPLLVVFQC